MVRKVVVTGSSGFVGSHTVKALTDRRIEVVGYDKKTGADLSWKKWSDMMVANEPDVIVHLAASCSTLGSINRPYDTFRDTVMTAVTVMDAAARLHVPVVVTSSVKARDGMTPYGASKVMVETWATETGRTFDFPVIINRPGTIYGPGQEGSIESGWIAWFLRAKRENAEVVINGDGYQVRDLLHVSDYVDLLIAQITRPDTYAGQTWDVGGGSANVVTVLEMVEHLGLRHTFGPERYGDARAYIGINDVPGWEPRTFWRESGMFD